MGRISRARSQEPPGAALGRLLWRPGLLFAGSCTLERRSAAGVASTSLCTVDVPAPGCCPLRPYPERPSSSVGMCLSERAQGQPANRRVPCGECMRLVRGCVVLTVIVVVSVRKRRADAPPTTPPPARMTSTEHDTAMGWWRSRSLLSDVLAGATSQPT